MLWCENDLSNSELFTFLLKMPSSPFLQKLLSVKRKPDAQCRYAVTVLNSGFGGIQWMLYQVLCWFVFLFYRYRKLVPKFGINPCFGLNMALVKPGTVQVGDAIYVVREDNKTPDWPSVCKRTILLNNATEEWSSCTIVLSIYALEIICPGCAIKRAFAVPNASGHIYAFSFDINSLYFQSVCENEENFF